MFYVSGKWYVAPIELNGTILVPFFIIAFLVIIGFQIKNQKINWIKDFIIILFLSYLWVLIDVTLFLIPLFSPESQPYQLGLGKQIFINLQFNILTNYLPLQLIGNLLLLAPFSFFTAIFSYKFSDFKYNILLMFLSSLSIETMQLAFSFFYLGNRTFDINDLLLNTIGSVIGYVFYKFVNVFFRSNIESLRER